MNSDITIVVCTFNRAKMLREALTSLYDLATDGGFTYEVLVVDNASTDSTQEVIAEASAASRAPLRGVFESTKGIVAARNRGIREATGEWIAFFDDDQIADRRWLAELFAGAKAKECRVVGGAVHLALPPGCERQLDPTVRMLLGESILASEPLRYGGRITPGCGNLMVRRGVFEEVGTFQTAVQGRGEDTDLFVRIERAGIPAWYLPTAIIHHMTPADRLEPEYLFKLARTMGYGIGIRQTAHFGKGTFTALWFLKALRALVWQWPLACWLRFVGDDESALGARCQIAISQGFVEGGYETLRPAPDPAKTQDPANPEVATLAGKQA